MYNPSFDAAITRPRTAAGQVNRSASGLFANSRIATPDGWQSVMSLAVGDKVHTLDHGTQNITRIEHVQLSEQRHLDAPKTWSLFVPCGAIGNGRELVIAADQPVLMDAGLPQLDNRAILQASELFGHFGIFRVIPDGPLNLICLYFETSVTLLGHEGVLYHCKGAPEAPRNLRNRNDAVYYRHLTPNDAEHFLDTLESQNETPGFSPSMAASFVNVADERAGEWMVIS